MAFGLGSLTSELNKKETAFQSLPQSELMKKRQTARTGGLPLSLTEALVAEKVLNDKATAANAMSASMQSDPRTVAQQNEVEIRRQAEMEVAKAVGQANANKMRRQQKNMQKLASIDPRMLQKRGLAAAPVQRKQFSAQGGIVGYKRGRTVEEEDDLQVEATNFDTPDLSIGEQKRKARNRPGGGIAGIGYIPPRMIPRNNRRPDEEDIVTTSIPTSLPITDETERFATTGPKTKPKAGPMQFSQAADDRALQRLLYMTGSAGFGLGNVSKAAQEFDQQEFDNKIAKDTLDAKQRLNKLTKNATNYQMLQNRLTQVNAEIQSIMGRLDISPIGAALVKAQKEANDDPEDTRKQQVLVEQQRLYNMELERLADPMGADVGLLVQQKELQEVIRSYTDNMKAADPMDAIVARNM